MTMAIMEAMEQYTRQREALQQIRDIPSVRAILGQPRVMSVHQTEPVQPYQPFSPPSSPAHLPPGTHVIDMPQPRTNQEGKLIRYTPAQIKQVKQARATRHDWLMEAVGCSREIAERATLNMDYDLSMAMHHAMYMQSVYLARQATTSPDVTKRFKKDDDGTVTANATDSMQMLKIPYYAYLDNFLCNEEINETVCFNEKDLEVMFTEETAVAISKMGTYMAVKEVCDKVVLTCDKWEEYNLMKDEKKA
jgi:hypothetical protein